MGIFEAEGSPPVALRAPSGAPPRETLPSTLVALINSYCLHSDSPYPPYTNFSRGKCLTFIDTEGNKKFDFIILSLVIVLYENVADQIRLVESCLKSLTDDGVLAIVVLNDAAIVRWSVKLATLIGKLKKEKLPLDFMAVHFDKHALTQVVERGGGEIKEYIKTGSNYGILESTRYLNMSKFRRTFGKAESEVGVHPQSIYEDMLAQSNGPKWLVKAFYLIGKMLPTVFSFYAVCLVEKKHKPTLDL